MIALRTSLFALCLAVATGSAFAQSSEGDANPDEERYEQAALDFVTWCGPCHGVKGAGDGPVAAELVKKPSDLTQLTRKFNGVFPAKQIRFTIDGRAMPKSHGTREMPVWGYWFNYQAQAGGLLQNQQAEAEKETKERIDRLVDYIKTLQAK